MAEEHSPWFEPTRDYTLRLVGIRSVSPSAAENDVAREVMRILGEGGLESSYAALGLDPIEGDHTGASTPTPSCAEPAREPSCCWGISTPCRPPTMARWKRGRWTQQALHERRDALAAITPGLAEEIARYGDDCSLGAARSI